MLDDKKIEIANAGTIHRLIARMPEFQREYGLWIINGSISCHSQADSFEHRPAEERRFEFYSLSHMYEGRGKLRLSDGGVRELSPGDAVLIAPGDPNLYGGTEGEPYVEDSVRFCGRLPDALRRAGVLRSGAVFIGRTRRMLPLLELLQDPGRDSWIKANLMLLELLQEFFITPSRRGDAPMDSLLEAIRSAPPERWWRVSELAELFGKSIAQLRRDFLKRTGMLPKTYIEQFKLRQAAELLLSSHDTVADVAARFGYLDCYHFSRRFKIHYGLSPDQYRRCFHRR